MASAYTERSSDTGAGNIMAGGKKKLNAISELLVSTAQIIADAGAELPGGDTELTTKTDAEDPPPAPATSTDTQMKEVDMEVRYELVDLIKTKSIKLNYDPMSDCFVFTKSAGMGGSIDILLEEDEVINDEAWPEFVGKSVGSNPMIPPDEDMVEINKFTARPHTKDEVRRVIIRAAGTGRDRHGERNRPKALGTGATISVGKSLMDNHNIEDVSKTWGRIYSAKTMRTKNDGMVLVQKGYLLNSPENQGLIRQLEAGIASMASVSYKVKRSDYMCSLCNRPMFQDKGAGLEHQAASPQHHPKPQLMYCGHYVGFSKSEKGEVCEGWVGDWSDYLETTRTGAPADPSAEFRIKSQEFAAPDASKKEAEFDHAIAQITEKVDKHVNDLCIEMLSDCIRKGLRGTVSTLSTDSIRGAQAVDETQKTENGQQATTPATAAVVELKPSEDLEKFTKSVEGLGTTVAALDKAVSAAAEAQQKQATLVEDFHKALVAEKGARDVQVKELGERFSVILGIQEETQKQLADLAKKVDLAASKSIDEMVMKLAAIVPNGVAVDAQEQAQKMDDTTGFYADTIGRVMKGRTQK
jgi:hypothetical protein